VQRAVLGHWTYTTPEGRYTHRKMRGEVSADQRERENAILGRGKGYDPGTKDGGKDKTRGETPANKGQDTKGGKPRQPSRGPTKGPERAPPIGSARAPSGRPKRPRSKSAGAYVAAGAPTPTAQPARPTCAVAKAADVGPPTRSGLQVGGPSSSSAGGPQGPHRPQPPVARNPFAQMGEQQGGSNPTQAAPAASAAKSAPWRPSLDGTFGAERPKSIKRTTDRSRGAHSRGAPKGARKGSSGKHGQAHTEAPTAPKSSQAKVPATPGGAPRGSPFQDARMFAKSSTIAVNAEGSWTCPICDLRHVGGDGVNIGLGLTQFKCNSCGDIAPCRNLNCDKWVMTELNPKCSGCGERYTS
jgi:hypothetical protein